MAEQKLNTRRAFSLTLCELAEKDDLIFGLSADMSYIISDFRERFPARFINTGIAEQNMVGIAAGLALSGMIPFVTTMAAFMAARPCEQIRTDVCYTNANVKIVGIGSGTTYGNQGNTHTAPEDMGIVSSFPRIVVLSPADAAETVEAVKAAARHQGPVYMRFNQDDAPVLFGEGYTYEGRQLHFEIGRALVLRDGKDVTLIATGCGIVKNAVEASEILKDKGVSAAVLNIHTVKPLDHETIVKFANSTKGFVVAEDHQLRNGLGAAVCQAVAEHAPIKVKCLGVPDVFVPVASHKELLRRYSLDTEGIVQAALKVLGK